MNRIFAILSALLALSCFGATNSSRIKDLPLATSTTTNTSFVIDDSTYGVRRVNFPKLVEILTNDYSIGTGTGVGDVTQAELTNGLAAKLDKTNGVAIGLATAGLDVTGNLVGQVGSFTNLQIRAEVTPNRALIIDSAGRVTNSPSVDPTELSYLDGVTSALQTQLTSKVNASGGTLTGGTLAGTTSASTIIADNLVSSTIANANKFAYWTGDNELTNNGSWADVTNIVQQVVSAVTGTDGAATVIQYIPTTYYDATNGTVNTNLVTVKTKSIQDAITNASWAYNTNTGPVTLVFPAGTLTIDELIIYPNVIYKAAGVVNIRRATDASGSTNRSIMRTRRADGVNVQQVDGSRNYFDSWKTGFDDPDAWYGLSDNIKFTGPGVFRLIVGDKALTQPPLYLAEVRNFVVEGGAIEVYHGPNTSHWGVRLSGRNVLWYNPVVKEGATVAQDGIHITNGRGFVFFGGSITSGDDSYALGSENNGGSNVNPDEALEDVVILGPICDSTSARALIAYSGFNRLNVPWTKGNQVRRVYAAGLVGHVAKMSQSGLFFGYFPDRNKIWEYNVTSQGIGYPDGWHNCNVTGGGGSGAQAVVRVSGGKIIGAWPRFNTGTSWYNGSSYESNGVVDLSTIASGSGGAVTAVYTPVPNDKVEDVFVQARLKIGSQWHSSTQAFGVNIEGVRRLNVDMSVEFVENATNKAHRPFQITSGEDVRLRLVMNNACQKAGVLNSSAYPGQLIDRIFIENGHFLGCVESGAAPVKLLGRLGHVAIRNNTFSQIRNGNSGIYLIDLESGNYNYTTNLFVENNVFSSYSLPPSTTYGLRIIGADAAAAVGTAIIRGNDFSQITTLPTGALIRSEIEKWRIMDNIGLKTRNRTTATIASGATSQAVTIGTDTGFPDTTDEGIACIRAVPVGDWGSATKWWITPTSATSYTLNVNTAPGGSGLKFAIEEDTTLRE